MAVLKLTKNTLLFCRNLFLIFRIRYNIPIGVKSISSLNLENDNCVFTKLSYGGDFFFDEVPYYISKNYDHIYIPRNRFQPEIKIVYFEYATIYGSRGAIATRSNYLVKELSIEFGNARFNINKHPVFTRLKKYKKTTLLGEYLLLCAPGSDTYAHWVFDILPRLILAKENGLFEKVDKIILSYGGTEFQIETLNLLNVPSNKIFNIYNQNELCIQLQKVTTISYPSEFNTVSSWVPIKLKSFYSFNCKILNSAQPKFVFIDRKDHRKVHNVEFYDFLIKYNFVIIFSEDLKECEKSFYFQKTEILISVFGSAGSNIIFCNDNCLSVSLIAKEHLSMKHSKFIDKFGWSLNNGGKYRTSIIVGKSLSDKSHNWYPILIDMAELESLLIANI
jgi:capsular polysaccharide biosynthesis protein